MGLYGSMVEQYKLGTHCMYLHTKQKHMLPVPTAFATRRRHTTWSLSEADSLRKVPDAINRHRYVPNKTPLLVLIARPVRI